MMVHTAVPLRFRLIHKYSGDLGSTDVPPTCTSVWLCGRSELSTRVEEAEARSRELQDLLTKQKVAYDMLQVRHVTGRGLAK